MLGQLDGSRVSGSICHRPRKGVTAGPVRSTLCPVLVGRAPQLAALRDLIDQTGQGAGHAILIAGEAGVGKTRLVAEARAYAVARGYSWLQGVCFQADRASPYAPLLDLLYTHFAEEPTGSLPDELSPVSHVLRWLLPDAPQALRAPGQLTDHGPPEKVGFYSALTRFFLGQAANRPLMLVVEDLHWSDDATLEFLHHLVRRCPGQRLVLVMTYRNDEAEPRLRHWLAQLDRERLSREVMLPRLTGDETAAMLRAMLPDEPRLRAELGSTIYALTEGNPFFVEEMLASWAGGSATGDGDGGSGPPLVAHLSIPRSVDDAVQQRTKRLSKAARGLASLAAVSGRRFDLAVLQALTGRGEARVLTLVKELVAAQLVVEQSADRFAFRHALTREALYADMLARERRVLHRQLAETIERVYSAELDRHLGELAYHCYHAGAWENALVYAGGAGERALALCAPREAVEHFTQALEAAGHLGVTAPSAIYRGRGRAHEWVGNVEMARRDYEAALAQARAIGEYRAEWLVLVDLGLLWAGADHARSRGYYEQALGLGRTHEDPVLVAHSLNRLGNWYVNADEPSTGQLHHREALGLFQARGDRSGLAATQDLLGMAACLAGDLPHSASHYRRAMAIALSRFVARRPQLFFEETWAVCSATLPA